MRIFERTRLNPRKVKVSRGKRHGSVKRRNMVRLIIFLFVSSALLCVNFFFPTFFSSEMFIGTTSRERHNPFIERIVKNVVGRYPHDKNAFTQGLEVAPRNFFQHNEQRDSVVLLEGTGLYGHSQVRFVDLYTGKVLFAGETLPTELFGEGITVWNDSIIQLTWKQQTGIIYKVKPDNKGFQRQEAFSFETTRGEGWGITRNSTHLFVSDGSEFLHIWDPDTRREVDRIRVHEKVKESSQISYKRVPKLNELEYVCGEILANIWYDDRVARINPSNGEVVGYFDLSGLLSENDRDGTEDCLNGIAFDDNSRLLYFTGKKWPWLYAIKVPFYEACENG